MTSHQHAGSYIAAFLGALLLLSGGSTLAKNVAGPDAGFILVPEMQPLDGIVVQPRREREALAGRAEARRGPARLESWVRAEWPRLRQVDLVALSRYHVDVTRGFELPAEPGELVGRAIGRDDATGTWFFELRGPRLPARYDVVHRYLHVYAGFDPATGELGRPIVTIRGWVLE